MSVRRMAVCVSKNLVRWFLNDLNPDSDLERCSQKHLPSIGRYLYQPLLIADQPSMTGVNNTHALTIESPIP